MASIQKDSWSVDQPFARMKGSNIDICVGKAINSVDFVVGVSFLLPLVLSYLHTRSHHAYEGTQIIRSAGIIKLLLFCQGIHGLCFNRLFHWDLDSVRSSFSDCFSARVAVVKKIAAKRNALPSLCLT